MERRIESEHERLLQAEKKVEHLEEVNGQRVREIERLQDSMRGHSQACL